MPQPCPYKVWRASLIQITVIKRKAVQITVPGISCDPFPILLHPFLFQLVLQQLTGYRCNLKTPSQQLPTAWATLQNCSALWTHVPACSPWEVTASITLAHMGADAHCLTRLCLRCTVLRCTSHLSSNSAPGAELQLPMAVNRLQMYLD